jgi:hypothetical protein
VHFDLVRTWHENMGQSEHQSIAFRFDTLSLTGRPSIDTLSSGARLMKVRSNTAEISSLASSLVSTVNHARAPIGQPTRQ